MKSPHLCRFNPYIYPNKHKFYSLAQSTEINLVQSTEINLDIKLNPFIIQPSSIILYLQPWWSAFSNDLFQSIPASLRPELPSGDPWNAGNLLHLFLQDAAHLKDAAGENQPLWRPVAIGDLGKWGVEPTKYKIITKMAYIEYRIDNFGLQKHLPESVKNLYIE